MSSSSQNDNNNSINITGKRAAERQVCVNVAAVEFMLALPLVRDGCAGVDADTRFYAGTGLNTTAMV